MDYITVDKALLERLRGTVVPVEFRDENGAVVGLFTPARPRQDPTPVEEARRIFDLERAKETLERESNQCRRFKEVVEELKAGASLE